MSEGGRIVDTNVIVRLLRKDEAQHDSARKLVADAAAGGQPLVLLDVVVAETVFVLESIYKRSRLEIADMMAGLLDNAGIASTRPDILLDQIGAPLTKPWAERPARCLRSSRTIAGCARSRMPRRAEESSRRICWFIPA
jgi:hypothetical protein